MSEEASAHTNQVNMSTSAIMITTVFFLCFRSPSSRVSILIYTTSLPSSLPYMWIVDGLG